MAILTLGISYRRAPIELLERLSFADEDLPKAYRHALDQEAVDEAVILSTCNRVEITANVASYHAGFLALKRVLTETRGVPSSDLDEPLYAHWEQDAADHLFAVAAGLDAMVLGETQIQGQVREALRRAEEEGAAGGAMRALFHAAARAGRRARAETSLGAAPDAFVAIGADLAEDALGSLHGRSLAVVGAGVIGALAAKHLRDRGIGSVHIVNRSPERARNLAMRIGATGGGLDELHAAIVGADLIVSATGAVGTVIEASDLTERTTRPLVVMDLAVPRDVDPDVAGIAGVRLIDISAIHDRLSTHAEETADDIARAHEIVGEEVRRWVVRRRSDAFAPLIQALRRRGEEAVRSGLDRFAGRLAGLTPDEREAVEALARGTAAKLLHDPIVQLKERSEPGTDQVHATLLAELFSLEPHDE